MATTKIAFIGRAVAGREAEFNAWYDDVHVPELLALVDGLTAVTRYRGQDPESPGAEPVYYNVYEVAGSADPRAVFDAIGSVASAGQLQLSDAMAGGWHAVILDEVSERTTSPSRDESDR